jgi:tetrahydrodipicolinate N-succinyltransferase
MEFKSTHGYFFNPVLKLCDKHLVDTIPLKIGNDVWIGEYAVILAHVTEIGDGAVIGAGTVVNKNVPPYAVVIGNPGRVVRYRFSKEIIEKLLASRWWEKDVEQIDNIEEFQQPYEKLCSNEIGDVETKAQTNQIAKTCLSEKAKGPEQ